MYCLTGHCVSKNELMVPCVAHDDMKLSNNQKQVRYTNFTVANPTWISYYGTWKIDKPVSIAETGKKEVEKCAPHLLAFGVWVRVMTHRICIRLYRRNRVKNCEEKYYFRLDASNEWNGWTEFHEIFKSGASLIYCEIRRGKCGTKSAVTASLFRWKIASHHKHGL